MLIHADCTPRYRCDEAIAAARGRLDAASLRSPLIENAAKRRDLDREVAVLDHHSRPDGGDDLALRDETARPLDQHTEQIERPRADRDRAEKTPRSTAAY